MRERLDRGSKETAEDQFNRLSRVNKVVKDRRGMFYVQEEHVAYIYAALALAQLDIRSCIDIPC